MTIKLELSGEQEASVYQKLSEKPEHIASTREEIYGDHP